MLKERSEYCLLTEILNESHFLCCRTISVFLSQDSRVEIVPISGPILTCITELGDILSDKRVVSALYKALRKASSQTHDFLRWLAGVKEPGKSNVGRVEL